MSYFYHVTMEYSRTSTLDTKQNRLHERHYYEKQQIVNLFLCNPTKIFSGYLRNVAHYFNICSQKYVKNKIQKEVIMKSHNKPNDQDVRHCP